MQRSEASPRIGAGSRFQLFHARRTCGKADFFRMNPERCAPACYSGMLHLLKEKEDDQG